MTVARCQKIDFEAAAQALLQAIPATDRVRFRTPPGLYGSFFGWLLLIGSAKFHPVARLLEHGMQVVNAPVSYTHLTLPTSDLV